jgi:hypothetical protein
LFSMVIGRDLSFFSLLKRGVFLLLLGAVVALSFHAIARAFTEPTQAPPQGNALPPINTGADVQTRQGTLIINSPLVVPTLCIAGDCRSLWPEIISTPILPAIYVTNESYSGNLGGKSGGDAKCGSDINTPSASAYARFEMLPWDPSGAFYRVGSAASGFSGRAEPISDKRKSHIGGARFWAWHPESCNGFSNGGSGTPL